MRASNAESTLSQLQSLRSEHNHHRVDSSVFSTILLNTALEIRRCALNHSRVVTRLTVACNLCLQWSLEHGL